MHSHTTADAPETVYFIRDEFYKIESAIKNKSNNITRITINYPKFKGKRTSMWDLIARKSIPPTRLRRYCCEVLKENCGKGRFIVTGARWAESRKRENRGIYESLTPDISKRIIINNDNDEKRTLFETCNLQAKRVCNPIIDWSDKDIWDYIKSEKISINPLYKCGFYRVGCIGCPLAKKQIRQIEFARFPQYKKNYILAFDRMIKERERKGLQTDWKTGQDVFYWWMEDNVLPGQINFFDNIDED